MTSNFRKLVPPFHRQGNGIPSAAIRWPDFGDRPAIGRVFAQIFHHSDTLLLSFSPLKPYDHDRWGTECLDTQQDYEAFVSCFDGPDDDDGDGKPDEWRVSHWVALELRAFEGKVPSKKIRNTVVDLDGLIDDKFPPIDKSYGYSEQFRKDNPDWFVRGHLARKSHAWRISHKRPSYRTTITLAEWICRTIDRLDPAGMSGPSHCIQ